MPNAATQDHRTQGREVHAINLRAVGFGTIAEEVLAVPSIPSISSSCMVQLATMQHICHLRRIPLFAGVCRPLSVPW